jgi:hypothetical protein
MANHTCNQNCGCNNTYTVSAPCPPACTEVFNAQCIVYTGTDILCGQNTVIKRYDYLDTVITKLVNYICTGLANVPITVVESDSEYILVTSSTVGNQTTYVLDLDFAQLAADLNLTLPVYNVVGSQNITVTTTTVANTTTFNLLALETLLQNTDNLLNITSNTTPGIDILYTVNIDLPALINVIPLTAVAPGPSANSFITTSVVGNLTTYSIDSKESIVAPGTHVTVTATGGTAPTYDTTYTVNGKDTTLALAVGEAILQLTSAVPSPNTTAYTLSTNTTALNLYVNTEINDVLDNTVGGFGIDAVYNGATQTLTLNFDGAAAQVGGGLTGNGTSLNPFKLDTPVTMGGVTGRSVPLKYTAQGLTGNATITHGLQTTDVVVSVRGSVLPLPFTAFVHGADYTYTVDNTNQITITEVVPGGLGFYSVAVIG